MKGLMLAVVAAAAIAAAVPKDRAAIMYYAGRDSVISLVPSADSANLAMILMTQWQGDSVPLDRLKGRPCLGVALFSRGEWAQYTMSGRRPEELRPRDAAWRIRVYPASRSDPIAIHDLMSGKAFHAIGLDAEYLRKAGATGPHPLLPAVESRMGTLRGACSVQ
jgi:hypothetical protein